MVASARTLAALALLAAAGCARRVAPAPAAERWVGTWAAAPQLTEERNMPPAPGLSGHTLRQLVRVSIGGRRLRVRFSNAFGDGPLTIAAATLAPSSGAGVVDSARAVALRFAGATTVTIPAGGTAESEPLDFALPSLGDVAVTTRFAAVPRALTGHPGSRTTSYLQAGDGVAASALPSAVKVEHWYAIAGIDVVAEGDEAAVVVVGNSITDGRGSGTDRNDRWPDNLARRLHDDPRTARVAVLNQGIGGNCVRKCGLGPPAVDRFARDVLGQPGVRWLVILEGVNDLGGAAPGQAAGVADELIAAYRSMVDQAHARGLRAYGATILPFGASFYDAPDREAARQTVNRWIRTAGTYDAVIDFDAVMRDTAAPSRLRADVDGGDHLHPNEAGYRAMADAIDLALFRR